MTRAERRAQKRVLQDHMAKKMGAPAPKLVPKHPTGFAITVTNQAVAILLWSKLIVLWRKK